VEDIYFRDHSIQSFDIIKALEAREVGTTFVKRSDCLPGVLPGVTINKWSGWANKPEEAGRENETEPCANDELANYLEERDQGLLAKHLATADWIHLSTLFDHRAMRIIGNLISGAKRTNLSLRVSWDVGRIDGDLLGRRPILRELLRLTDFVILSQRELLQLAGLLQEGDQTKQFPADVVRTAAKKVYDVFKAESTFTIVVQSPSFSRVDFFWRHRQDILFRSVVRPRSHWTRKPIDVTAASAYLSAAVIDAYLQPDLSFDLTPAIEYGMDLVWAKLLNDTPESRKRAFKEIRKSFEESVHSPRKGKFWSYFHSIERHIAHIFTHHGEPIVHHLVSKIIFAILLGLGAIAAYYLGWDWLRGFFGSH
jgi:hypothetical protein